MSKYARDRLDTCAAYAFLQAYALHPGWAVVDHELDMLENVVDQMSRLERERVDTIWNQHFNLQSILETFRYKMEQLA